MKHLDWSELKNVQLKNERSISFEDAQTAIEEGKVYDDKSHPNKKRYPHQRMFVVEIDNYAYLVPYVQNENRIFLKTIIPSRKATRDYLRKNQGREKDNE